MYYNGEGVVLDLERAEYWFTRAAEDGQLDAQIILERIQFEKPYKLLKTGHYFEASKNLKEVQIKEMEFHFYIPILTNF